MLPALLRTVSAPHLPSLSSYLCLPCPDSLSIPTSHPSLLSQTGRALPEPSTLILLAVSRSGPQKNRFELQEKLGFTFRTQVHSSTPKGGCAVNPAPALLTLPPWRAMLEDATTCTEQTMIMQNMIISSYVCMDIYIFMAQSAFLLFMLYVSSCSI